jgi:ABC-2 type transport system ATP-binding protein
LVGGKVVHAVVAASVEVLPIGWDLAGPASDGCVAVTAKAPDAEAAAALVAQLAARDVDVRDLDIVSPSLDDVFFHLAGQGAAA